MLLCLSREFLSYCIADARHTLAVCMLDNNLFGCTLLAAIMYVVGPYISCTFVFLYFWRQWNAFKHSYIPHSHRHYLLYLILGWYCSSWNASRFRGNARTIQNSRQKPTHFIQLGRRFCIIRIQLCRSTNIQGSKLWSWIRSAIRSDGMKPRFLKVARQTSALFDNWIELNWRYF